MRGLPEYRIYTSISSHVRGCSHDFFLQDPSSLERSKGRTAHGGRPGSASSTLRTTRETSSSRSSLSLRRLAPALQACLLFSPTGLKRTVENLGDVFLALYMFSASFIFQDLRISDAGGFLVRRDPSFRACCACSPLGRTKGSRRWLGLQE